MKESEFQVNSSAKRDQEGDCGDQVQNIIMYISGVQWYQNMQINYKYQKPPWTILLPESTVPDIMFSHFPSITISSAWALAYRPDFQQSDGYIDKAVE